MNNPPASAGKKPGAAYFIATACGLGYLRPAPGTWGSLGGVLISFLLVRSGMDGGIYYGTEAAVIFAIAAAGMIAATRVSRHSGNIDPQFVVIDEVSGQLIAFSAPWAVLNWKSWLTGFILFRVFDIWKPFPARQAESLPEGLGIMADDWIAGIYAAILLLLFQRFGFSR